MNLPSSKNWKKVRLGDVADVNKLAITSVYPYSEIEYIDVASVSDRKVQATQVLKLKDSPSRAKRIIRDKDILISTVRPNLKHFCFIKKAKENSIASTGFAVVSATESDPLFLYYYLTRDEITEYLTKIAEGQTSAYPAFNPSILEKLELSLPSISDQRSISALLGSLDDKIELLRAENATLERMAEAIFKEWFVDFRFPGATGVMVDSELGKIPEGWRVGRLSDICKRIASGGTPSTKNDQYWGGSINWFSTKELQDNFLMKSEKTITDEGLNNSAAKLFPENTILVAIYAAPTVGRLGILTCESAFNQAACGLVVNEEVTSFEYIYLLLLNSRDFLNQMANGAAQQNLSVGAIRDFKIVIPEKGASLKFKNLINHIFLKVRQNSYNITGLSKLRDSLLNDIFSN